MKICVFGAASAHIDEIYIKAVEELGEKMAQRGHSLVYGAGSTGLMGAAARGVERKGGYVHGVVPSFFKESRLEVINKNCDKITYTETMRERKAIMEDDADAFIVVPGGVGTFEEMFEIITLKQLGRHNKAIAIFNINGYYDVMEEFMRVSVKEKFITKGCSKLFVNMVNADDILDYIENYVPVEYNHLDFKGGEEE